jgi:hypothetical protein
MRWDANNVAPPKARRFQGRKHWPMPANPQPPARIVVDHSHLGPFAQYLLNPRKPGPARMIIEREHAPQCACQTWVGAVVGIGLLALGFLLGMAA